MRSRTVETNYSLPRISSARSFTPTLLLRFKYHLFRNVLPIIFILLTVGWLSLVLAEQIHHAKKYQSFVLADK
jgi:hypothetical protein